MTWTKVTKMLDNFGICKHRCYLHIYICMKAVKRLDNHWASRNTDGVSKWVYNILILQQIMQINEYKILNRFVVINSTLPSNRMAYLQSAPYNPYDGLQTFSTWLKASLRRLLPHSTQTSSSRYKKETIILQIWASPNISLILLTVKLGT